MKQIYLFWGGSRVISRRFNLALYNEDVSFLEFTKTIIFRGLTITMLINHLQVLGWSSQNILTPIHEPPIPGIFGKPEKTPQARGFEALKKFTVKNRHWRWKHRMLILLGYIYVYKSNDIIYIVWYTVRIYIYIYFLQIQSKFQSALDSLAHFVLRFFFGSNSSCRRTNQNISSIWPWKIGPIFCIDIVDGRNPKQPPFGWCINTL